MKKIVLFLHGYGSNGSDLISLKDHILDENCGHSISPLAINGINQLYKSWF